jgi:hypothetical protein
MFPSDRMARFNSEDQKVLGTLRKVVEGHGEFKHLNSKQKIRAMSRLVREQLHQASLVPVKSKAEGDGGDGDDDDSVSTGDSCGSKAVDSRVSGESYQRDSFCASDSSRTPSISVDSNRGGSTGGGGDSGGGSSSEGSNSDSEDGDEKRANMRKHSANSLGTPKKAKEKEERSHSAAPGTKQQLVLLGGNEDLPMWKIGAAKYKNGFSWESYLHHKQQFDNYMAHRGQFSQRTFKSVIHANLVPVVCASCGFSRSKWALVSDARLILRIERVLRPSRSTDFAMELKGLKITRDGDEALQASYSAFAEKFLSEAEDAGRPIKSVVIKAAFKAAVDKEIALKTWFEGDRWRGVNHAHARLLRKLREARSWEAISKSVLRAKTPVNRDDANDMSEQANDTPASYRRAPRRRANITRGSRSGPGNGRDKAVGRGRNHRKITNNSTRNRSNGTQERNTPARRAGSNTADRGESKRSWQGYDQRGESWHDDSKLFECYKRPCNAPFCQRCAKHGHTAETCRVPDGVEGLNSSGYFQEKRPGKVGPKRPPPRLNSTGRRRRDDEVGSDGSQESSADESYEAQPMRNRNNSTGKTKHRGQQGRNCL